MKILGKSIDSYIVEMSRDEIANLQGLYGQFSYRSANCKEPECGDTVEIEKFYDMVHNASSVIGDINQFRKKMDDMLKYLHDFEFVTRKANEGRNKRGHWIHWVTDNCIYCTEAD